MRIFVGGGGGYIGSVMCRYLLDAGHEVVCQDRFFFGEDVVAALAGRPGFRRLRADINRLTVADFAGCDRVIQLAGLSNDPASDLNPAWTQRINFDGVVHSAQVARAAGVTRFVFASSCSVYGHAETLPVTEESPCHPQSLYAESKLYAETALNQLASDGFVVAHMRNATVYGLSPRMRYDLIINSMAWHAFVNRKVYILGGGQQWRPLVHILDVCRAAECFMNAPAAAINQQKFNVGSNAQNYRVAEVAAMVKAAMPSIILETVPEDADKRSYNVSFDRIAGELGFQAAHHPDAAIKEILGALEAGSINPHDPRGMTCKYYLHLAQTPEAAAGLLVDGKLFDC
jgi:nucleoside-diphosphate-sugar epimerase